MGRVNGRSEKRMGKDNACSPVCSLLAHVVRFSCLMLRPSHLTPFASQTGGRKAATRSSLHLTSGSFPRFSRRSLSTFTSSE